MGERGWGSVSHPWCRGSAVRSFLGQLAQAAVQGLLGLAEGILHDDPQFHQLVAPLPPVLQAPTAQTQQPPAGENKKIQLFKNKFVK